MMSDQLTHFAGGIQDELKLAALFPHRLVMAKTRFHKRTHPIRPSNRSAALRVELKFNHE